MQTHPENDPKLDLWATPPDAPHWLVGLWRRDSILFPDGTTDEMNEVFWGQTARLFVDLRIPKDRPSANGRRSFDEFSLAELRCLADQKGFAGHLTMDGNVCSWVRYIDYRPFNGRFDSGRLRVDGLTLYEEGDATSILASAYQEIYRRQETNAPSAALRLVEHKPSAYAARDDTGVVLIFVDDHFCLARGRAQSLPQSESLRQLVEAAGSDRALIHAYLDCEVSIGTIGAPESDLVISRSTLPFRENDRLWPRGEATLSDDRRTILQENDHGRFRWRVVDTSFPAESLAALLR